MLSYRRVVTAGTSGFLLMVALTLSSAHGQGSGPSAVQIELVRFPFENDAELLSDFVSQSPKYRTMGREGLTERRLGISPGRFGNCVHIEDGWPISKGAWNESGLDCDLIVATMWGEWHKKPHFWGAGAFHGERGTVAFWVKKERLHPGIVFMQGSVAWGRKERDLFTVEADESGRVSAHIRDIQSVYHRVESRDPVWVDNEWQHITVAYDRAYGMKLYHNGRLVGSTWGEDAWWMTTYPGLFSPFLPESWYDEICFFDSPLTDEQVLSLFESNTVDLAVPAPLTDSAARARLLGTYGDLDLLELPTVRAGSPGLRLTQAAVADCSDGPIPAWWVFDGRYELAWPHPYRLFTFIVGDADYHGTKVDIALGPGARPNYISFEGNLSGLRLLEGRSGLFDEERPLIALSEYNPLFYSQRIELEAGRSLRVPLIKGYGMPEDLEGSARLPLSGPTRIHEIHLWRAEENRTAKSADEYVWFLSPLIQDGAFQRYEPALRKLKAAGERTVVPSASSIASQTTVLRLEPMQAVHFASPGMTPDLALDALSLTLLITPSSPSDTLWFRVRDPANPSRIWAMACVRAEFEQAGTPQPVSITMDITDLLLACEDRVLVEMVSATGCGLVFGDPECPAMLSARVSTDRKASLLQYTQHALLPARMQYSKQYNYRPWRFTGEHVSIQTWNVFGGPYDMAYPPLAVLRHAPDNRTALFYQTLLFDRTWFGTIESREPRRPMAIAAAADAPAWAVWQRELYALSKRIAHWITEQQRDDGTFWGGANDDTFIPLGWAALPLLGDEPTRRSWLRLYDGIEALGIFHDGYCDIWPIDPLHITDFIASRGLMIAFALGDPAVLERELRTAERYAERMNATNEKRAAQGLPLLTGDRSQRGIEGASNIDTMEAEIFRHSKTHVLGYVGLTPAPEPYRLTDRIGMAKQMMDAVQQTDETAVFGFTEARVHTDNQRGIARDTLIAAALGGRVQGYLEPFPPSIAVSWEDVETEDLARLVTYADDKTLRLNLYNFREEPVTATLRVWRLRNGRYRLAIGPDGNDDGEIDERDLERTDVVLRRFSAIPITAPPRRNIVVALSLEAPLPQPETLPDLAISPRDVVRDSDGSLRAVVHNIGAAAAERVMVAGVDKRGTIVASHTIEHINTPVVDLAAQRAEVRFDADSSARIARISIDPDNLVEEIFEENNTVVVQ